MTALVIDDSASMRKMITFTLQSAGYEVIESEDGKQGLDALVAANKVDVVITDVNMPVMDGIQFIREARMTPAGSQLPILVLTTDSDDESKSKGRAAGATGWIVKPFRPESLVAVLQKVLK